MHVRFYIQNQTDPFQNVTKGQNKALTFTFLFVQWPKAKIGIHCVETTSNSIIINTSWQICLVSMWVLLIFVFSRSFRGYPVVRLRKTFTPCPPDVTQIAASKDDLFLRLWQQPEQELFFLWEMFSLKS